MEAVEVVLCQEVYHCPPAALDDEDYHRLMAHYLALNNPKRAEPWAKVEVSLCRDVYHCLPSVLDEQEWNRVQAHLLALQVKAKVENEWRRQMAWLQEAGFKNIEMKH